MKILIVGLTENPQFLRLVEEGEKRGHTVVGCKTAELVIMGDENEFVPHLRGKELADIDVIYLWAVGKRRWEWYTTALYLNNKYGTKIVNYKAIDPNYNFYLTPAIDYYKQTQEHIAYPKTAIIFSTKSIESVEKEFTFPCIVKVANGRQGKGVHKVGDADELKKIVKQVTVEDDQPAVIREFIPNDGDIRVFTVGYKAIGAMKRTPKEGDFRSNISQGGHGEVFDLDAHPEIRQLAEKESELMRTEIAGVDVIIHKDTGKPYILEINPGPQFQGFEQYTGKNAAEEIIKYFESLH